MLACTSLFSELVLDPFSSWAYWFFSHGKISMYQFIDWLTMLNGADGTYVALCTLASLTVEI